MFQFLDLILDLFFLTNLGSKNSNWMPAVCAELCTALERQWLTRLHISGFTGSCCTILQFRYKGDLRNSLKGESQDATEVYEMCTCPKLAHLQNTSQVMHVQRKVQVKWCLDRLKTVTMWKKDTAGGEKSVCKGRNKMIWQQGYDVLLRLD